ncbi:MAG: Rne/Rng family ribonuclease [Desulfobulbaceae bacterium]|nr:Rne/Rng family ribonuclease [Desulfobulbaceae bacterium]
MSNEKTTKDPKTKKPKITKASTGAWWKNLSLSGKKKKDRLSIAASTESSGPSEPSPEIIEPKTKTEPETDLRLATKEQSSQPAMKSQTTNEQGKSSEDVTISDKMNRGDHRPSKKIETTTENPSQDHTAIQPGAGSNDSEDSSVKKTEEKSKRGRSRRKRKSSKKPPREVEQAKGNENDDETVIETEQAEPRGDKNLEVKLLINAEEAEECRIVQLENGRLESFHVAGAIRERTKNNIYKGRIVSIEANLQAAFVDIGTGRNGFLPFNDIHPEYYREDVNEESRKYIAREQYRKLKIENVIKTGQEVLVQVVKEVTGNKGANMTTYISLPGRYLVLMPGSDSAGISRKIGGEERRQQLREIINGFDIPEGIGFIVRTASADITEPALREDVTALLHQWEEIRQRGQTMRTPALISEEQDIVIRFLRDYFTDDIQEILVDTQKSYDQVMKFVDMLPSKQRHVKVKLHRGARPIFNHHNVEEQIESIYQPQVSLPSGGSIVINSTEALVAIDVNSGRTSKDSDFEETIFLANMEAASELARQLRLRDLGGLIVVDFIDMRNKKHIREVEKQVKISMKRDKAKVDISRISRFGLMQISRQKMGAPIEKGSYKKCEHCQGRGMVKSVETLALYYLRRIQTGISRKKTSMAKCYLPVDVARYLLNKKRNELNELEAKHGSTIEIIPDPDMKPADNNIEFIS